MTRSAFYPGSFDPVTNGHVDIVRRAAALFDRLVVGVGAHHGKSPMFPLSERVAMLRETFAGPEAARIAIVTYDGLTVDAAKENGAAVIVRGLRDGADFDYEMQMAGMNAALCPGVETLFLASASGTRHIAASLVRQIAAMGGDVSTFVPSAVVARLDAHKSLRA
jgi:pantetheine-phosphate adenylyltransferase